MGEYPVTRHIKNILGYYIENINICLKRSDYLALYFTTRTQARSIILAIPSWILEIFFLLISSTYYIFRLSKKKTFFFGKKYMDFPPLSRQSLIYGTVQVSVYIYIEHIYI